MRNIERLGKRRGYVILSTAFVFVVLMGFAGLAIDVGFMQYTKRRMQAAADSGAMAGALEMRMQASPNADVSAPVRQDVATNGFTDGLNAVTVAVNSPPTAGTYAGRPRYVEVVVRRPVPTFFMRALNWNQVRVTARAVGGPATPPNCIYALNPTAAGSFKVWGSAGVSTSCGVLVNSSSPSAIQIGNAACMNATSYGVVGGYSSSGGCGLTPAPTTGIVPFRDPLEHIQPPVAGPCDYNKFKTNSDATLSPGVYCGGITVNGGTVRFNPGTYILMGGGMKVTGGSSLIGSEVMFYNTGGAGSAYDSININGGGVLDLSAPTTGPYESILFYQDRVAGAGSINVITGDTNTRLVGTLYFPTSTIKFTGNTASTMYTTIIGDMVEFTGNSHVNNNYANLSANAVIRTAALVE